MSVFACPPRARWRSDSRCAGAGAPREIRRERGGGWGRLSSALLMSLNSADKQGKNLTSPIKQNPTPPPACIVSSVRCPFPARYSVEEHRWENCDGEKKKGTESTARFFTSWVIVRALSPSLRSCIRLPAGFLSHLCLLSCI